MDFTVRHGKRRRDSDGPGVPAQPAARGRGDTGSSPSSTDALVRPTISFRADGKDVRLRDVELQAPAVPLAAAPRRQPDASDRTDMPHAAQASAAPLLSVKVDGQIKYAKARLADMNEGLVTARRTEAIDGLYSEGFASCRAVILHSATAVGLSHTSSVGSVFLQHVDACRAEFRDEYGDAPVRLVIGASVELHRAGLEDEWDAYGGDDFLVSERMYFGEDHVAAIREARAALREPSEDDLRLSDVDIALNARLARLSAEARKCGAAELVRLPHGAVMVPLDGPIDLLDGPLPRAVSRGLQAAPHAASTDRKSAPDPHSARSNGHASMRHRAQASHQAAAAATRLAARVEDAEPAEFGHGAIVAVSHAEEVLYPHARLVVGDGKLSVRRAGDASTGLLTQDVTRELVLALIGPPFAVPSLSGIGPQPRATALMRLDTREDYREQADRAVREFERTAGGPVQARVGIATEDFEAHVEAEMDQYSVRGLLEEYGAAAIRPDELAGEALLACIVEAHKGRAQELADRLRGEVIDLPNNIVFLDPSGELDVFANEPDVSLAPSVAALAAAAAAQNDAALLGPVRRLADPGVRPTRPSAARSQSAAVARDTPPASPAAGAPTDDSEPPRLSGGSPAKLTQ